METINTEQTSESVFQSLKQELSEKSAFLNEITTMTSHLEAELKELEAKLKTEISIPEQIEALKRKNANLTKEIEEIQSKNAKREAELNALTERTIKEFAHICNEPLYLQAFSSIASQGNSPEIYKKGEMFTCKNAITIDNLDGFQSELSDNMETYGANSDKVTTIAFDFRNSVEMGKQFLVCGQYGDEFADCVSALLSGVSADKIQITSHENAMCSLVSEIQSSTSKVLVIHNALDTLNDSLLLPVVKLCKDKILIFTCTNEKIYSIFPEHWSIYVSFLHLEEYWIKKEKDITSELKVATCPVLSNMLENRGMS